MTNYYIDLPALVAYELALDQLKNDVARNCLRGSIDNVINSIDDIVNTNSIAFQTLLNLKIIKEVK